MWKGYKYGRMRVKIPIFNQTTVSIQHPPGHYNAEYENMVQYYYNFVGTDHRHETRAGSHQTCSQLPFNLLNGLFWIVFLAEVVISFIITLSVTVQPLLYRT